MGGIRIIPVVALALLAPLTLAAAADRVMTGQPIYVASGEEVGDVVCIGCSARIEGRVLGDAVVIGGRLSVPGTVQGDAVAVGGGLELSGAVDGDAVVVAGRLRTSGNVGGDAVAVMGGIDLQPGAAIAGDVSAVFGGVRGRGHARIGGSVHSSEMLRPIAIAGFVLLLVLFLASLLFSNIVATLVSCVVLGEQRLNVLRETVTKRAGLSFALGVAALVICVIASIVWALALFWAPGVEFPFGFVLFVLMAVGYSGISLAVGRGMLGQSNYLGASVWGAVVVTLLQWIPIIGWIGGMILAAIAMGAAVLSGFGTSADWLLRRGEPGAIARPAVH